MSKDDGQNDLSSYSMLDIFRMEVETQLAELNTQLLALEHEISSERWESLLRAAHSIKGAARMVEAGAVVRIIHRMEDCFVAGQNGRLQLTPGVIDSLLAHADCIQSIVGESDEQILAWEQTHAAELDRMDHRIAELLADGGVTQTNQNAQSLPSTGETHEPRMTGSSQELRIHPKRLDKILGLAGEVFVEGHRFKSQLERLSQMKRLHFSLVSGIDQLNQALMSSRISDEVRSQLSRLSKTASQVRQEFSDLLVDMQSFDRRTGTLIDQLHHEVLSSRMRPFSDLLAGLPRLVRDVGRQLGKDVRIEMSGANTLVDREILERIDIPLKHLVQNAIDHGIESPEQRRLAGKPPVGTLRLDISQSAGMLFVVLSDDGAGVDLAALKNKLVRLGLCGRDEVERLDEMALLDYLFASGISSRDQVTHYSGRGIGLDVVKETVESLQGSVHATSDWGRGCRFQMLLPLTVSVIRVLQARIGGENYAFPLGRIHRLLHFPTATLETLSDPHKIYVEGEAARLIHANPLFGRPLPAQLEGELAILVIGKQAPYTALIVEDLLDEQELALQQLEPLLGNVQDISAAALLEDGSVTLIVDCDELLDSVEALFKGGDIPDLQALLARIPQPPRVLVADDSVTARVLQRKLLEKQGYDVVLVEDGEQAWDALQQQTYDMLISDVEMPKLNGLSLLAQVRNSGQLKQLPVLLLSFFDSDPLVEQSGEDAHTRYFSKTEFDGEQFTAVVKSLLVESGTITPTDGSPKHDS